MRFSAVKKADGHIGWTQHEFRLVAAGVASDKAAVRTNLLSDCWGGERKSSD
jgi:hypothetical protein